MDDTIQGMIAEAMAARLDDQFQLIQSSLDALDAKVDVILQRPPVPPPVEDDTEGATLTDVERTGA